MATGAGVAARHAELIARAHTFKLHPDYGRTALGAADVPAVVEAMRAALDRSLAVRLGPSADPAVPPFDSWVAEWAPPSPAMREENRRLGERPGVAAHLRADRVAETSLRGLVYGAVRDVFEGLAGDAAAATARAVDRLDAAFVLRDVDRRVPDDVRRAVVALWFAICH
jgi:hypothetical protein